jgi:hypothetical protein
MYKQFLREPMWFKMLIATTLVIAIIGSSSLFSDHAYYQGAAKLATAIFFGAYGINMRRNRKVATLFFALTGICMYLSWRSFELAGI